MTTIIGLCGKMGSGKDTVADILIKAAPNVFKVALADPMKRICKEVFGFTDKQLWGPSECRNEPDIRYVRTRKGALGTTWQWQGVDPIPCPEEDEFLTPRHALQQLGSEWGRRCHKDVWVDYALRVARSIGRNSDEDGHHKGIYFIWSYEQERGLYNFPGYEVFSPTVIIPDVRFQNEVDAIHAAGGRVWKINRTVGTSSTHISETEMDGMDSMDLVIDNNGSLDDLRAGVLEAYVRPY